MTDRLTDDVSIQTNIRPWFIIMWDISYIKATILNENLSLYNVFALSRVRENCMTTEVSDLHESMF